MAGGTQDPGNQLIDPVQGFFYQLDELGYCDPLIVSFLLWNSTP
jgi:hypothetical protein